MKKTKTKWRLSRLPEPSEILDLVKGGLLTKEEGREIIVSLETEEDRSKKSLQDEIKFLRELVAKMSTNRSVIIETIREVQKPYKQYDWYQPYMYYASAGGAGPTYATNGTSLVGTLTGGNAVNTLSLGSTGAQSALQQSNTASAQEQNFTDIKTF